VYRGWPNLPTDSSYPTLPFSFYHLSPSTHKHISGYCLFEHYALWVIGDRTEMSVCVSVWLCVCVCVCVCVREREREREREHRFIYEWTCVRANIFMAVCEWRERMCVCQFIHGCGLCHTRNPESQQSDPHPAAQWADKFKHKNTHTNSHNDTKRQTQPWICWHTQIHVHTWTFYT